MLIQKVKRSLPRKNFAPALNTYLRERNLRPNSKALVNYVIGQSDTWKFSIPELCNELGIGINAVYSAINQCIEQGYAYRHQGKNKSGDLGECKTFISDCKEEVAL